MLKLIEATTGYEEQIENFKAELIENGDSLDGCGRLRESKNAKEFLDFCREVKERKTDLVPSQQYFAIVDNTLVGMIDLRFHIDHPILSLWGGHIGYSVRPSKRSKGYAKEMLRLVLQQAKQKGIKKVLITCLDGNTASEKTILANKGVYERTVTIEEDNLVERIKRFWIDLDEPVKVVFYELDTKVDLKYAVIIAKYNGKYVMCKHKKRNTLEIPGGRREENEDIFRTAERELYEETGALHFDLNPVCIYSVVRGEEDSFGMLFCADIFEFEADLHNEIEKIYFVEDLNVDWTYPQIQPKLIEEAKRRFFD